jgi:hypothetical protein
MEESSETWPETLIYISCGWESFKKVIIADMSDPEPDFVYRTMSGHQKFYLFALQLCEAMLVQFWYL